MNSTEKQNTPVVIVGYFLVMLIIYIALILADVISDAYLQNIDGRKAAQIEAERACDEDYQKIEEARRLGYRSLLYPDLYDSFPYRSLAEKYGVAPLAPRPNKDLYYCNEGYGQIRYRSDRYGFRNVDSIWDMPLVDVVLIGDSFVHGACVGADENISGHLLARGMATLNLGTGGNSPVHYAAIAKTFLGVKAVKNAVMVFYPNDNISDERESVFNKLFISGSAKYFASKGKDGSSPRLSRGLDSVYEDSEALLAASVRELDTQRQVSVSQCAESKKVGARIRTYAAGVKSHLALKNLHNLVRGHVIKPVEQSTQKELPYGSRLAIELLQRECEVNKCRPLVVYIPNSDFWRPDPRAKHYARLLRDQAEKSGVPFLDASTQLAELGRSAYAIKGPHLSPEGYSAVAALIAEVTGGGR